jgi:hypothetical protein
VHVEGGDFGVAFDSDTLTLPLALSVPPFEQGGFARAALPVSWTGGGEHPLRIRLMVAAGASDPGGNLEIQCLVEDDGAFTIPAAVVSLAPAGTVDAYVTREVRELHENGGHTVLLDGKVENGYRFTLQ